MSYYPNVYASQAGPLALSTLDANFNFAVDIQSQSLYAAAGGFSDAITATYTPAVTTFISGLTLYVRAATANTTTTPTFSPNSLTAHTIVKINNQALAVGDIAGAGHILILQYDATNNVWELVNPATVSASKIIGSVPTTQIQPISASVASNALTISASSLTLDFRSTTLGSGTVTTVSGTPANLVVPSGATLGTINATQSRIVVLAINNAGTIELAVSNISGGVNLTETGVISTTAISSSATSASTVYSTTGRSNVAYRVIGYIESTQATAGTWATAPSTIQGEGGQALTAMSSLGYGQTWQTFTVGSTRVFGTTYYNTTGKPIVVQIYSTSTTNATLSVNGTVVNQTNTSAVTISAIVPPGASYVTGGSMVAGFWAELR